MQSEKPDLHIIGHWNYPAGTKKTIFVAASHCDTVELSTSDRSKVEVTKPYVFIDPLDKNPKSANHGNTGFIYAFPEIAFTPGTLRVTAKLNGKVVAREEIVTAGEPAKIKLTAKTGPGGLRASGADIALIDVEVVDAQGRLCPTDEARIDFEVAGPALWRGGINSGIPNSTNNRFLNTECGINRVAIRSLTQPGKIVVRARRQGLELATIEIESKPFPNVGGLAPVPEESVNLVATAR